MRPILSNLLLTLGMVFVLLMASQVSAQHLPLTVRASLGWRAQEPDDRSDGICFSQNGRFVMFTSTATNLVVQDENDVADCFLLDLLTHDLSLVSLTWDGQQGDNAANGASIAGDGSGICFRSWATNFVKEDTNGYQDVFYRNLKTGEVTIMSQASDGRKGNGFSTGGDITPDGRYVAFASQATNLVVDDTNGWYDIFVRDRRLGTTERVSVSSNGEQGDYPSGAHAISADGRFVAFSSQAHNLIEDDWNGWQDVFVHDRWTGETEIVSVSSNGELGDFISGWDDVDISANGRYVTFDSGATNLVDDDTNGEWDVFVHDRWTGETERVSISSNGEQGNGSGAKISDDGRYVVFWSSATTFDSRDRNSHGDVYVHDRLKRTTTLVSISTDGEVSNDVSVWPSISGNGRFIGFDSDATNLAPNDDNRKRDVFIHLRGR